MGKARGLWMAVCLVGAGCAAEPMASTEALSGPDDCRLEDRCEGLGPAEPRPMERPPSIEDVPRADVRVLEGRRGPYDRDEGRWIHEAVGYADRSGMAFAGFPTFEHDGEQHGALMLFSTAIAGRVELPRALAGDEGDAAGRLRRAQAYANSRGYPAALPYFEGGETETLALLSWDAIELRRVDLNELGAPDAADVAEVFRGAQAYAREAGFAGALPAFEVVYGEGRAVIDLALIRREHAYLVSLPEAELSPYCGRWELPACNSGPICIDGTLFNGELCASPEQGCGNMNEPCCGGFCELGMRCVYHGFDQARTCAWFDDPGPSFCGDGTCELSEHCGCDKDCGRPVFCDVEDLFFCENPEKVAEFCVSCPWALPYTHEVFTCDGREQPFRTPAICSLTPGPCP